jgi:hypothetical protein
MEWGIGIPVAIGGLFLAWVGVGLATGRMGVENCKYTVARRLGPSLELRAYPAHLEASVRVAGADTRSASSRGFRHLASYIFGGNAAAQSIAMTAPVVLTRPREGAGQHTVSFVLPSSLELEALPRPSDPRVELARHEPSLRAVRRLGLSWAPRFDEARLARELLQLEADAAAAGLSWDPATVHRTVMAFDPPWTPFFIARTEVALYPVAER